MQEKTRRRFLKMCTKTVLLPLALKPSLYAQKPEYHDSHCGGQEAKKVLVTYASAYGSTKEMAEYIAKRLCEQGYFVDIKWVQSVEDVTGYEKVIVGSAIQYDTWLEEAQDFVKREQEALSKIPVAYFFTCLTLASSRPKAQSQAQGYAENICNLTSLKPVDVQGFAGVLDYSKMSFVFRHFASAVFAVMGVKEGDYRDWEAVDLWTKKLQTSWDKIKKEKR